MADKPLDDLHELYLPLDNISYGGWWARAVAFVIDIVICYAILLMLAIPAVFISRALDIKRNDIAEAMIGLTGILVFWLYFSLMESSNKQATLGKRWLGLQVVNYQYQRISFAQATGRFFSKFLSYFILYAGFVMAAFTLRKQALHDKLANTLVIKKT